MNEIKAKHIAQEFLDKQGESTMSRDIDAAMEWFDIPFTIENSQGRTVATNSDEMRALCTRFIEVLQDKRLTHLSRRCLEAKFKGPETLWIAYESRYVRDGKLLAEAPYVGFIIIRRRGDCWKVSSMQFADSFNSPTSVALRQREHATRVA